MSFLAQLRKDKMQAMKDKDKVKVGVLSLMMSGIALAEKEQKRELTDDEAIAYVQKEMKQTKDAFDMTPESRPELREELSRKMEIIERYLPKQLSLEEVEQAIRALMEEKNIPCEPSSKGTLMKETMAKLGAATDGKTVNQVVTKILS